MNALQVDRYEAYVALVRFRIGEADERDAAAIHSLDELVADISDAPDAWLGNAVTTSRRWAISVQRRMGPAATPHASAPVDAPTFGRSRPRPGTSHNRKRSSASGRGGLGQPRAAVALDGVAAQWTSKPMRETPPVESRSSGRCRRKDWWLDYGSRVSATYSSRSASASARLELFIRTKNAARRLARLRLHRSGRSTDVEPAEVDALVAGDARSGSHHGGPPTALTRCVVSQLTNPSPLGGLTCG